MIVLDMRESLICLSLTYSHFLHDVQIAILSLFLVLGHGFVSTHEFGTDKVGFLFYVINQVFFVVVALSINLFKPFRQFSRDVFLNSFDKVLNLSQLSCSILDVTLDIVNFVIHHRGHIVWC